METLTHTVRADEHRLRLDRYLMKIRPDLGRHGILRLLRTGAVTVNGQPRDVRYFVKRGETILLRVVLPEAPAPPRVILRAPHLIILAKPPNMPTNPAPGSPRSLLSWFESQDAASAPGIVHRLDRDTSGLVLLSLSPEGHRMLSEAFRMRTIRKRYLALVTGRIHPLRGVIDHPLARTRSGRVRVDPNGQPARTEYATLKGTKLCSLVEARPRTGRMHQIRVHFASLGHPIAGDPLYGDPRHTLAAPRLWLHAAGLEFPVDLATRLDIPPIIECPLWEDLAAHLHTIGLADKLAGAY